MKGTLRFDTAKFARCGLCSHYDIITPAPERGRYDYAKEARRLGWSNTKQHGWICPSHTARAALGSAS